MESWGFAVNEAIDLEVPTVAMNVVESWFDLIIDGVVGSFAVACIDKSLSEKINFKSL